MEKLKMFLKRKDIEISGKRYGIDALGAMAQGLFASLLIGTIISTIGERAGLEFLVEIGGYAKAVTGEAMAVAIGYSLHCPPLVLFHWRQWAMLPIHLAVQVVRWQSFLSQL